MRTTAIKKQKKRVVTVDKKLKTHENDPVVVKKVKAIKELINKYGLPENLK